MRYEFYEWSSAVQSKNGFYIAPKETKVKSFGRQKVGTMRQDITVATLSLLAVYDWSDLRWMTLRRF
jgi:hypothetical protein